MKKKEKTKTTKNEIDNDLLENRIYELESELIYEKLNEDEEEEIRRELKELKKKKNEKNQ